MKSRIGILGGMFDPVHNGHIAAARLVLEEFGLQQLKMIPCHIPNHRDQAQASSQDRLAMLKLAAQDEPRIEVDSSEIEREQTSYTVDTLAALRRDDADAVLVFVLGMDSFNSLLQWHQWPKLFALCHLVVMARPGFEISAAVSEAVALDKRQVSDPEELFEDDSGGVCILPDFDFDMSSSDVRQRLLAGKDLAELLDSRVSEYICTKKLYLEN